MNDLIFSICDLVRDPIRDHIFSRVLLRLSQAWKSFCNTVEQLAQLYVLISD